MRIANLGKVSLKLAAILAPCLLAAPLFGQGDDPPARVARLSFLNGTVSMQRSGENQWSQATLNYPVTTGDRLYTDRNSRAELEMGPIAARLSESTDLTMTILNDDFTQLGLAQGAVLVRVFDLPSGNPIEVDTPNGALTLLSAGDYRIDSFPNDGSTLVVVTSGSLEVSSGGVAQTLQSGQAVRLTGVNPIQISPVSLPPLDGFDQWNRERDRRFLASSCGRNVSRDIPGCADLDQHGRWEQTADYGPVWHPTAVSTDWVPYRYGRWAWIEPWGWTWVEDAPWGFAPFHYGRWVFAGVGWGWVPGPVHVRHCYAPALVAFVGGPRFSFGIGGRFGRGVGFHAWFPLGPGEPFFPWYHHGPRYLERVNFSHIRNGTNIADNRNINDIRYVNRPRGTTAVPEPIFRSGQPIGHHAFPVDEKHQEGAEVIPHPTITPTGTAITGGRPAPNPPTHNARVIENPRRDERPRTTLPWNRPSPEQSLIERPQPSSGPNRFHQPEYQPPVTRNTPEERSAGVESPGRSRPQPIMRTPPPAPNPSFQTREPAMARHPGRPLEPQQIENLRSGRPAGPMRDREFPQHPAPVPRAEPSPRSGESGRQPAARSSEHPRSSEKEQRRRP